MYNSTGYYITSQFGEGAGPIHMDYVACNGTEFGLLKCRYITHNYGCTHRYDVGIHCEPGIFVGDRLTVHKITAGCYQNNLAKQLLVATMICQLGLTRLRGQF